MGQAPRFDSTVERFSGFADVYDTHRPAPPPVLAAILIALSGGERPAMVVDLGSGSGLSTRYWADHAARVTGVEPSADMRRQAAEATTAGNVSYRAGFAHETGLPDAQADIVTAAQAFHWMDPGPTLAEVARVLRPGGVFAAYDYDWPPVTPDWRVQAAFRRFTDWVHEVEAVQGTRAGVPNWEKAGHLDRMEASGRFRFTRELCVHTADDGSAARLVGLALSLGSVQTLLKCAPDAIAPAVEELRAAAGSLLGDRRETWYWTSRVRVGIV